MAFVIVYLTFLAIISRSACIGRKKRGIYNVTVHMKTHQKDRVWLGRQESSFDTEPFYLRKRDYEGALSIISSRVVALQIYLD